MKALTVRQPWAHLIAHNAKWIETRTRPAPAIAEPFLIHAGVVKPDLPNKVKTTGGLAVNARRIGDYTVWRGTKSFGYRHFIRQTTEMPDMLDMGVFVAKVRIHDCLPIVSQPVSGRAIRVDGRKLTLEVNGQAVTNLSDEFPYGDYTPGRWAWLLTDVERLNPEIRLHARGQLGFWNVKASDAAQIAAYMPHVNW